MAVLSTAFTGWAGRVVCRVAAFLGLFGPGAYALKRTLKMSYPVDLVFVISLAVVVVGVLIGMVSGRLVTQSQTHAV